MSLRIEGEHHEKEYEVRSLAIVGSLLMITNLQKYEKVNIYCVCVNVYCQIGFRSIWLSIR